MSEQLQFPLGVVEIQDIIPHRYPFLFVDRILEFTDGERIVGEKNVSANEPFFQGHFPGRPIMPGVVILEALAQVGAVYSQLSADGKGRGSLTVFSGLESVRFRKQVVPGDVLRLEMAFLKQKLALWRMKGTATVNGEVAAEGILLASQI